MCFSPAFVLVIKQKHGKRLFTNQISHARDFKRRSFTCIGMVEN